MNKKKIISIVIGIAIIVSDQLTKMALINKNITLIPNLMEFTYTKNTGAAFGIGSNNIIMVIIVNVIILGFIIKFLKDNSKKVDFSIIVSLVLILSGAIGNLIDRLFRGFVIDFIDINVFNFPNFNIADISIVLGIFVLIIVITKSVIMENKEEKE